MCNNRFQRLRALSPAIKSALSGLRAESRGLDIIQTQVDELLPLKNKLDELRKRVKEIDRAVKDLLDNDEDMALMYLLPPAPGSTTGDPMGMTPGDPMGMTRSPSPYHTSSSNDRSDEKDIPVVTDEIPSSSPTKTTAQQQQQQSTMGLEMMLENYLNEMGWIASEVDEVLDTIINTEENVELQLDLLRNRILKVELRLSISSFVITSGALVTGLFGRPVAASLSPPHITTLSPPHITTLSPPHITTLSPPHITTLSPPHINHYPITHLLLTITSYRFVSILLQHQQHHQA